MKFFPAIMLLLSLAICAADKVVPVYEEPFHRAVPGKRDYQFVLDVSIPPGRTTLFHTHAEPTLYVALQRQTVRAQRLNEEWGEAGITDWAPGNVRYDGNAVDAPFTHRVENLGKEDFRLTLIASTRRTPNSYPDLLTSLPGDPGLDNEFFAQSRIDLEPGQIYDYGGLGVSYELTLVMVTDGAVVISGESSDVVTGPVTLDRVGEVEIRGAHYGLRFENTGGAPATIIAVAVR